MVLIKQELNIPLWQRSTCILFRMDSTSPSLEVLQDPSPGSPPEPHNVDNPAAANAIGSLHGATFCVSLCQSIKERSKVGLKAETRRF